MSGQLRPCSLRCLKTLAEQGPQSIAALDKLHPDGRDHRSIINGLRTQAYVETVPNALRNGAPVQYKLTAKAKKLLKESKATPGASKPAKRANAPTVVPHYARQPVCNFAAPVRVTNATTSGTYSPSLHSQAAPVRPGADAAFSIPSRHCDELHYRDGRVAPLSEPST